MLSTPDTLAFAHEPRLAIPVVRLLLQCVVPPLSLWAPPSQRPI